MILSELINFFSHLFESADLHPNITIFMLVLLLLIIIAGSFVLLNLRKTSRSLIAVDRELDIFAQNIGPISQQDKLSPNHQNKGQRDPESNVITDDPKKDHTRSKAGWVSMVLKGFKAHVPEKLLVYLPFKKMNGIAGKNNEEFTSSLLNNSGLRKNVYDLICKTDKSISLQHLVKHLSGKYFDGNYHPVLNELEQLERRGKIEGQVVNGKIFYKKRQNAERKYILRKGRNFRRYIG